MSMFIPLIFHRRRWEIDHFLNLLCEQPTQIYSIFTDVDDTSTIDDYCYYVVILLAQIFPMPNISAWVTILAADS
jgi:hypothetical protein